MKKLIFLILLVFIAYSLNQKRDERKREKLVGAWAIDRDFKGAQFRLILNLKSDGDASVEIDATKGGRSASKESSGKWKYAHSRLSVTFTRGEIPVYQNGKEYGGHILTLEDKTLSYKSDQGVETWTRIRIQFQLARLRAWNRMDRDEQADRSFDVDMGSCADIAFTPNFCRV